MMRKPISRALAASAALLVGSASANAAGDPAAGEQVFKKVCTACHSNESGVNKAGPSLFGVYGRKAGTSDFPRYKGLVGADFTWDEALLNEYLQDPKAFVVTHTQNKTTAMTYSVKDAQQRADVIAYLQTLKK
jgi:cytochrome c